MPIVFIPIAAKSQMLAAVSGIFNLLDKGLYLHDRNQFQLVIGFIILEI